MSDSLIARFTQRAQRVLRLAQEEAESMSHDYIGTEHLLLGLTLEENGIAGNVLRNLGATSERVKLLIYQMTGSGKHKGERTILGIVPIPKGGRTKLDLQPATKQVIEFAVEEARKLKHGYISTEHLLLGVLRQKDGMAIDVIRRIGLPNGLTREQIRHNVLQMIAKDVANESSSSDLPMSSVVIFPKKPIKLGLTNEAKQSIDDVLLLFDTGNSDLIAKLGEYARVLLTQYDQQQDKPE